MHSRKSEAPPRWATRRRLERSTYGGQVAKVAGLLGTPLMPWQRLVVDTGLEIDPETGLLAYRELIVTVMRQSGKSTLVLSLMADRCLMWGPGQRVAYTAQTGWDARRKLIDDYSPVLMASPLSKAVRRVLRGAGSEGIVWENGSRADVMASSASAGHGRVLDQGFIDEAFDDTDDRREQAILPAMATKPNAQLAVVSTAGTEASVYLRRKVDAGRHATAVDRGSGVAYFEWSIPDDRDVDDPEVWWQFMPALGWTITQSVVEHARQTMSDSEFRRGFCNQWTATEHERVIPLAVWEKVCDPLAKPDGRLQFGLDVLPDQSAGAISAHGGGEIELIDHRPGVAWLADRAEALSQHWNGPIVIDGGGPAVPIGDELERRGVTVIRLNNPEVASAAMAIYNAIADEKVKFRTSEAFDTAVAGLAKRPVGDRFAWSRSISVADITPFTAATFAFVPQEPEPDPWIAFL